MSQIHQAVSDMKIREFFPDLVMMVPAPPKFDLPPFLNQIWFSLIHPWSPIKTLFQTLICNFRQPFGPSTHVVLLSLLLKLSQLDLDTAPTGSPNWTPDHRIHNLRDTEMRTN
mmetsp:Transcript_7769/g.15675  ORF Transcript_7769/g.15675 Transcript_7769/m.15675 type:complete len:113 (-) Transcript_7769:2267-2605(-)